MMIPQSSAQGVGSEHNWAWPQKFRNKKEMILKGQECGSVEENLHCVCENLHCIITQKYHVLKSVMEIGDNKDNKVHIACS